MKSSEGGEPMKKIYFHNQKLQDQLKELDNALKNQDVRAQLAQKGILNEIVQIHRKLENIELEISYMKGGIEKYDKREILYSSAYRVIMVIIAILEKLA